MGNSIPIVLLPGIVAILADSELVFLAISSERLIIFDTLTPGAGSNSYNVTTGPWLTFFTSPSTPKSNKIFSKAFSSILFSDKFLSFFKGVFKKCGPKTACKYFDNLELFKQKLEQQEGALERYNLNQKIIDFNMIPQYLVDEFKLSYNIL